MPVWSARPRLSDVVNKNQLASFDSRVFPVPLFRQLGQLLLDDSSQRDVGAKLLLQLLVNLSRVGRLVTTLSVTCKQRAKVIETRSGKNLNSGAENFIMGLVVVVRTRQ